MSATSPPTVGTALSRRQSWAAILCLSLVSGLLFLPATSANATSFVVFNTADEGQGSLRQAILDANAYPGADDITFAIAGAGALFISPRSPLPAITEQVSIDASTQPGASCASSTPTLVIRLHGSGAGADAAGLTVADGTGTVIKGFIIRLFDGDGISLNSPASETTVTCNAIGTTPDGTAVFGVNGAGVAVRSTDPEATAPTTISRNVIMNNGGPGVLVGPTARSVSIRGNFIDDNLGVGIDLVTVGGSPDGDGPTPNVTSGPGAGGNDLRFTPDLASASSSAGATQVTGSLDVQSADAEEFVVEFFSVQHCDVEPSPGGFGEGARPIGSIALPAVAGPSTLQFVASDLSEVNDGNFVTATATDGFGSGNTSEFSACIQVVAGSSSADLSVAVLNVPNPVTGGYDLGSTATVTNLGPGDATGVTLTDALAPGESFVADGSDPSCAESANVVTCDLGDIASGGATTVLIVTKTPKVAVDTTIHDAFAVLAPEDDTPDNDALDVATVVRALRDDFVAGYVPASRWITWLNDAMQWSHGDPVATIADPTVAFVGIPGGGPGGPVIVTELPCGAPFACMALGRANRRFSHTSRGVFGHLIQVSVPSGYDASNPITGVFLDNWSVLGSGGDPFKVSYQNGSTGAPNVLPSCGGWKHTGPPCVSSIGRSFSWWNPYAYADLQTVVRFTNGGTFGRGR